MPKELILIRHGQTSWTRQKRYCGWSDIGLDEAGKSQAAVLKKYFGGVPVDKVYASDLFRASEFARLIFGPAVVLESRALRELCFGELEGITYEEALRRFPVEYGAWLDDPWRAALPGAESMESLARRVRAFMDGLRAGPSNATIAVVSHAGPLRIILGDLSRAEGLWKEMIETAGVYRVLEGGAVVKITIEGVSCLRS